MADAIRVTRGGVYTPEWMNADREEADKIRVHFRFLSFAEQQALTFYEDLGKNLAFDTRQLEAMITKVENFSVIDESDAVREITNGKQLVAEPAAEHLCLELWMHFRKITAVDKKKLPSESDSGAKDSTSKRSAKK